MIGTQSFVNLVLLLDINVLPNVKNHHSPIAGLEEKEIELLPKNGNIKAP